MVKTTATHAVTEAVSGNVKNRAAGDVKNRTAGRVRKKEQSLRGYLRARLRQRSGDIKAGAWVIKNKTLGNPRRPHRPTSTHRHANEATKIRCNHYSEESAAHVKWQYRVKGVNRRV